MGIRYRQASPNEDGDTPLTSASIGTVLSINPMRVQAVWDREACDGVYGRSRPRKERL